jgi:signal transduction histidine kinase/ligand-binding sensor domain-containing protein
MEQPGETPSHHHSTKTSIQVSNAPSFPRSSFRVQRWTTEHGLPQNLIGCIKQTRDGYMWLGTWNGLARFDGVRFTVFNKFNTPALTNGAINALAEDSDGTLWIGTSDGLVSYGDHKFERGADGCGLPDKRVWRLAACSSGGIWLHAHNSVCRLGESKCSRAWRVEESEGEAVWSMHEAADGWLQIFTTRRWLALSPEADQLRTNYVLGTRAPNLLAGSASSNPGIAWVGTTDGLERLCCSDLGEVSRERISDRPANYIYQDRHRNVWLNVQHLGLCRLNAERQLEPVSLGAGLERVAVGCMEEDMEGNLWAGTDQGLFQLQPIGVRTFTEANGPADNNVLSVCEGSDGTLWAGTDHGVSRIVNDRITGLSEEKDLLDWQDRCICPDAGMGLCIAKQGHGLFRYRNGVMERCWPHKRPAMFNVLYGDRSGRLWIGTQEGVFTSRGGKLVGPRQNMHGGVDIGSYADESALDSRSRSVLAAAAQLRDVHAILEDRDGVFWFGTKGKGLARCTGGQLSVLNERHGLSDKDVWSLHEDAEGTLWIGTDNGLTRYRNGKLFPFKQAQGLCEENVNCVLEDDAGHLWISGQHGIYRLDKEQLNAVADGRAKSVQPFAVGVADGMENAETNGGENQPAGWKAHDARLWFPTIRGVVVIDPKLFPLQEAPPRVVIEEVRANEQIIGKAEITKQVEIPAGHGRVVEFRYTANTFVAPERARFKYRLTGMDADWQDGSHDRTARYINLKPGNYCFEVMAANHHNTWSAPVPFAFSLAPFFWQTWPFYIACAVGLIGLAIAVQSYRLKWQQRLLKVEEQRAIASERSRIARDLHDDLGANLTGVALQLDLARSGNHLPEALQQQLAAIAQRTRGLVDNMREAVWAMNPQHDNVESLASFLGQYTEDLLAQAGLRCRLDLPPQAPARSLSSHARHELFLVIKEALQNILRHARASEVHLRLEHDERELRLAVSDNGRGLPADKPRPADHGLDNMEKRVKNLGGNFVIKSSPGQGTCIEIVLSLDQPERVTT